MRFTFILRFFPPSNTDSRQTAFKDCINLLYAPTNSHCWRIQQWGKFFSTHKKKQIRCCILLIEIEQEHPEQTKSLKCDKYRTVNLFCFSAIYWQIGNTNYESSPK